MRDCGGCTQCCKTMGIVELKKPINTWCEHCAIGGGCKIYENRPETCRGFVCAWLTDMNMPEDQRPDKTKVVLWAPVEFGGKVIVANVDPRRPRAAREGELGRQLQNAIDNRDMIVVEKIGNDTTYRVRTKSSLEGFLAKLDKLELENARAPLVQINGAEGVPAHAAEAAQSHSE